MLLMMMMMMTTMICNCVGDDRASQLHRGFGAVPAHAEGPVLPYGREEPVLAGHHAADPRRALQQSRDHPDVPLAQPDHRPAAPHLLPVCRLRHQTGPLLFSRTDNSPPERLLAGIVEDRILTVEWFVGMR